MTSDLFRPLAIVGSPVIVVLVLLQIFNPETVAGIPASTVVGVAMITFFGWSTIVALIYKARWTGIGFVMMTTAFTVATLSERVIQNRLVIYPVIAIAVPFIFIGGKQDNPTSPVSPHSGRGI